MSAHERLIERALRIGGRIAFPEATDPRVLDATARLAAGGGRLTPVLVGRPEEIVEAARYHGAQLRAEIVDVRAIREHCARRYQEIRRSRGVSYAEALQSTGDPLLCAALLVADRRCSALAAGVTAPTAQVIRTVLRAIGLRPEARLATSVTFLFLRQGPSAPTCPISFADCSVIPSPSAVQLAEIARQATEAYVLVAESQPRVAFLSFSTKGSAQHRRVEKVREALRVFRERAVGVVADGELQLDAAIVPEVAARKAPGSLVAGHANVLVFPDLGSGHIGHKLVQILGAAEAAGPYVLGLEGPVAALSRGSTAEEIVRTAAVLPLLAPDLPPL